MKKTITMVLLAALMIGTVIGQWQTGNNLQHNTDPYQVPKNSDRGQWQYNQQQTQSESFQKYLYNPSMPPMTMPPHHQTQQTNYPGNTNRQQRPQSYQEWMESRNKESRSRPKQRALIDYPFTVEYIDRSNGNSRYPFDDSKLIDYPFTVEFINGNSDSETDNNENNKSQRGQFSNNDAFQFSSRNQHQNFQTSDSQNEHRRPSFRNQNNGRDRQSSGASPARNSGGHSGNFPNNGGGGNNCRFSNCAGGY